MNFTFFYLFSVLAFISCFLCVFSNYMALKNFAFIIFLLSISGIFALINSGYIAFIMLVLSCMYYSYISLKSILLNSGLYISNNDSKLHIIHILIISLTGALSASLLGSTIWQGKVYFYKEITLANFAEIISGEYFIFFLVIIVSSFLILLNSKQEGTE